MILRPEGMSSVEVGLGHRRLSILDLSSLGHQPMQDPETGNWIIFNGEIYNFRELRKRLEQDGVRFRSYSDTEVLLKAFGRWNERCLDELRGMFAFAIWDAKRHRLFLARDPMGIKPLYYCTSGPYFLFASEVRALLATGLVSRRLDHAGLLSYLSFGSVYEPATLLQGVSAVPPGHYMVWQDGTVRDLLYWDLAPGPQRQRDAAARAKAGKDARKKLEEELDAQLYEAVGSQLVSDVPVGVFLSGGIDSSAVTGILSRAESHNKLNTFSIVFREQDFSEAEYSRMVAEQFGTTHHEILVSQHDVREAIPSALAAMDQPTMDGLNTFVISRQTRAAGIKVALSGLGGDELFAGYSSFDTVPRMERFSRFWEQMPGLVRAPLAGALQLTAGKSDKRRKLSGLARASQDAVHPYFLSRMVFTPEQRDGLLTSPDTAALERMLHPLQESVVRTRRLDPINRVSYMESRFYMLNTLLRDADAMSMAHGLELRVPLIDHRLAEKMFDLPGEWKLNSQTPKPLLVRALQGNLPEAIVRRPKRGFTLPFDHWLREELRGTVEETLEQTGQGALASLLNPLAVRKVWQDFLRGRTSWSRPWTLFVLQRWCDLHAVRA
jgi:asparagine synthase (glutamine-hydrolysing)